MKLGILAFMRVNDFFQFQCIELEQAGGHIFFLWASSGSRLLVGIGLKLLENKFSSSAFTKHYIKNHICTSYEIWAPVGLV